MKRQNSCPQMTQMDADKSRIWKRTRTFYVSFKCEAHAPRTGFLLACLFICVHLRHLRTEPPVPSFELNLFLVAIHGRLATAAQRLVGSADVAMRSFGGPFSDSRRD